MKRQFNFDKKGMWEGEGGGGGGVNTKHVYKNR